MDNRVPSLWKNKSFVLYLIGQTISALGDGFYLVAFMWFALEVSGGKGIVLGGLFSIYTLNEVVFGFIAGPIADKINKKRLLIIADILRGLLVVILFVLVKNRIATVTHLYVITFCFSVISPFFHRTEFTVIPCILNKDMLLKGNGILVSSRRLMQIISPALGGVVISLIGIEGCFLIDGGTFLFSALFIGFVTVRQIVQKRQILTIKTLIGKMKEGYIILVSSTFLLTLAIYAAFINFLGGPIFPLLPILAERAQLGSSGYGVMMSAISVGLIVSGFIIGFIEKIFNKIKLILIGLILSSLSIILLGFNSITVIIIIAMFILGMGLNLSNLPIITLFQEKVNPGQIGVVSSFVFTIAQVAQPISIALSGFLADFVPLNILFLSIGTVLLIGTLIGFILPQFRKANIPITVNQ